MPSVVNRMAVRELTEQFRGAEGLVVVSMAGLTMVENESLRGALAAKGVQVRIVPNKLALIALEACGHSFPRDMFRGCVGVAWGDTEQTIEAAKILTAPAIKKVGKVAISGGMLEGNVLGASDAGALADVPTREELRSKLLGLLNGPARALVTLLHAPGSSLARAMQAKCDKEGAGAA